MSKAGRPVLSPPTSPAGRAVCYPATTELTTTEDQWREALAAAEKPKYPEGKTVTELAKLMGVSRNALVARLGSPALAGKYGKYQDYRNRRLTTVYVLENQDGR